MNMFKLSQPTCKACGQPILGSYFTALDATWHPEHFLCAACHKPINDAQFNLHEGSPYHPECYRRTIAPRCAYCGQPLVKEYLVDHWGTKFCKEHQGQYPACSFCGRLVPPQQQEPGMKRGESVRCPTCRASAIETIDQARPIFKRLIQWVNAQSLFYNNLPLSLELVDRSQLAKLLKGYAGPDSLGATMNTIQTVNGRVMSTKVDKVAVLEGLPSIVFQGVVIHELGHVWLIVHDIKDVPSWAEEGFCEFLPYRYYTQLNTDESRYHAKSIESNPNPVYGEGFRHVRAIVDARGFQQFVKTMQTTKRLPSS